MKINLPDIPTELQKTHQTLQAAFELAGFGPLPAGSHQIKSWAFLQCIKQVRPYMSKELPGLQIRITAHLTKRHSDFEPYLEVKVEAPNSGFRPGFPFRIEKLRSLPTMGHGPIPEDVASEVREGYYRELVAGIMATVEAVADLKSAKTAWEEAKAGNKYLR